MRSSQMFHGHFLPCRNAELHQIIKILAQNSILQHRIHSEVGEMLNFTGLSQFLCKVALLLLRIHQEKSTKLNRI